MSVSWGSPLCVVDQYWLACRVLKPGNTGLTGSVPGDLPYPLLMATVGGPYQPIKSGTLGACCACRARAECSACSPDQA